MSNRETEPDVQLPGYTLIEKIGAGGYGEVWSADAPGGLRKAVKFVFGDEFDKRATSELHALEKIKSVRHPFLLSLERIEVIDGRLVVVSELADGSLRDRFRECLQEGLSGIPRDELVGYLADAADALDFISSRHELAHLDIKPENLLLVAGHVKVADFGLVKSLNNHAGASLVGGMTPTYAAPEVYRGTPCRHSDQYSLAILYQEMLTGAVPFGGANAAELTLQHMNDDPDLGRLSQGDRFAVARALSKDPDNRFETASAFVAAIRDSDACDGFGTPVAAAAPGVASTTVAPPKDITASRYNVTEVFESEDPDPFRDEAESIAFAPKPLSEPEATELPAPDADPAGFEASPALFIGIGGTGARVLRALRAQMCEHLGATAPLPSAPMLLLDTDAPTLASATRGSDRGRGLDANETIALPLRRPQAYRDKADLLLRWLGRRWLYNIPRSLETEGIRPLGRLALIDHARQAFQRLRGSLASAVDDESRRASTDAVGLPFTGPGARVYVVASAAGGAGSGMSIDVAYAARSILDRLGVEGAKIIGVVTHSTYRDTRRGELARVNSYAWLSEFERFRSGAEGYPGDSGVGLPAHSAGVAPFDHTYFVPLGDQVDTPAFESSAEAVAEYLFADAFTPGQRVLDACRAETDAAEGAGLRSLAVRHRDGQGETRLGSLEGAAVARMLDRWIGVAPSDDAEPNLVNTTDQVVHGAIAFLGRMQLDASTLASNCRSLIEASLGGDASAFFEARFGALGPRRPGELAALFDKCFGILTAGAEPRQVEDRTIDEIVEPIAEKLANASVAWTLSRVSDQQERLEGARRAIAWLSDYLVATRGELDKVVASIVAEHSRLAGGAAKVKGDDAFKLFRLRLDHAALVAARRIVAQLRDRLAILPAEIDSLGAVISGIKQGLDLGGPVKDPTSDAGRLSVAIEQRLQSDYLTQHGGLLGALTADDAQETLAATIRHAALVVAREMTPTTRAAADAALKAGFADPPLPGAGGKFWRLTLEQPTAPAADADPAPNELLLVTEMAGVSLPHVAAALIGCRRDYAAFAERVRTRRDIAWDDPVVGSARDEAPVPSPPNCFTQADSAIPTAVLN